MGDELKFQQRWEFRRKDTDFDCSSDESKSSATVEPVLERHTLVSGLISLDDNKISNASRPQQDHHYDPGLEGQVQFGKGKEKKGKRTKKNSLSNSEMKRDSHEGINRKKRKTAAYGPAALYDVKSYTEALLEELKAARENLFTWMMEEINKLAAYDNASASRERRKGTSGGKKVQARHHNYKKNMEVKHQKSFEKMLQFQNQNNSEEITQEQHLNSMAAIVHMQQENSFEDVEGQLQRNSKSVMRAENCSGGSLERLVQSTKETDDANNHFQTVDNQVDYGQATGSIVSIDKEKGQRLALTVNSKFVSSPSNQNVKVQHPKSVVLAISAPNSNDGSSARSVAGKKTADSNKQYQVPKDQVSYSQPFGSMICREKDKSERLRLFVEQSFSPKLSDQAASSMHLTSSTVFPKPHELSNRLDTSFCNFIQAGDAGNKASVNMESVNQMPDFSLQYGYLPSMQPEERRGNFAQMTSRNMSCFQQNGTPFSSTVLYQGVDGGYIIPGQFYSENFPRENCNTLSLRMNGGSSMFSRRSNELSEHLVANNLHSISYTDSRLTPFETPSIRDGYLIPR